MISFFVFALCVITWILFLQCMLKYLRSEQNKSCRKKQDG